MFCVQVFGSFMRPLVAPKRPNKPLLQRMAEDKAMQMERGSMAGSSYCMVQLPDGTCEKRLKPASNADPGVHSSFDLDEVRSLLTLFLCLSDHHHPPAPPRFSQSRVFFSFSILNSLSVECVYLVVDCFVVGVVVFVAGGCGRVDAGHHLRGERRRRGVESRQGSQGRAQRHAQGESGRHRTQGEWQASRSK